MKLGKFIIIDKPLCISSKELDEIRKVYKSSNSNFLCFMSRRYSKHTLILEKYIQNRSGPFHMDFLFQVPIKDTDDHIYREGGRLVGEMCHHVDLAIYLFGKPVSIHYVDNEKCKEAGFRENLSILMSFKCGSSAHIRYSSIGNSEGIKERIKLNFDNDSIEVIDFKKTFIIANEKRKILHNEFDKGFYGSWSFINELILQDRISSNETKKLSELDILVTKVLLREDI